MTEYNLSTLEEDLTSIQFPEGTIIPAGQEKRKEFATTRDYVLLFPVTQQRYQILKQRVEQNIRESEIYTKNPQISNRNLRIFVYTKGIRFGT